MAALKEVTYRRKYAVATAAAESLKSLTKKSRLHHMDPNELKNELDAAVVESVQMKEYETIVDSVQEGPPVDALLVPLPEKVVGKGLWAVIHEDKFHKPGTPTQVILSVQTSSQVDFNRQNGKWRTKHEPGLPMQTLGSKLPQEKLKAMMAEAKAAEAAPPPVAEKPPLAAAMERVEEKAAFMGVLTNPRFKLTWEADGETKTEIFRTREELTEHMEGLVIEGGSEDLVVAKESLEIVWKPLKTKVKIELE